MMAWLVVPVAVFTYASDRSAAEARLLSHLENSGISAERRHTNPSIVARCLAQCLDFVLWRCWTDRLEFNLEQLGPGQTRVTINAVPNLLRVGAKAGERVVDLVRLSSALQKV